ncbi:MAG TPA: tripartite tricarboxylate transporter TctB family protein [Candidatus Binatia bacterium]
MTTDRVSGAVLVLFAFLVILASRDYPLGTFRVPGPAFVPTLLAALLLIFGVLLVFTSSRAPRFSSISWIEWRHAAAILAACVFAVFATERLGYRLTVLLILVFLIKFVERRGWAQTLLFAFGLAFGSFYLFYTLLRVPLPAGPLGF